MRSKESEDLLAAKNLTPAKAMILEDPLVERRLIVIIEVPIMMVSTNIYI